jgi:hypothetical protein
MNSHFFYLYKIKEMNLSKNTIAAITAIVVILLVTLGVIMIRHTVVDENDRVTRPLRVYGIILIIMAVFSIFVGGIAYTSPERW